MIVKNSHSVLTFVSRMVPKLHEYDIFENCWFLSMTNATKSNHFKQRRQTPVRSFVRTRSHPTDGRDANRIGERRRGDGDGDGDDVERDGWK